MKKCLLIYCLVSGSFLEEIPLNDLTQLSEKQQNSKLKQIYISCLVIFEDPYTITNFNYTDKYLSE